MHEEHAIRDAPGTRTGSARHGTDGQVGTADLTIDAIAEAAGVEAAGHLPVVANQGRGGGRARDLAAHLIAAGQAGGGPA